MHRSVPCLLAALLLAAAPPAAPSPAEIVAGAPPSAWRPVDPDDLLLMDLAGGRHVAIELAPAFAPAHVANLRTLVRGRWFDGNAVVRVQDNYVAQWGGADEKKPLPAGVAAHLPAEYARARAGLNVRPLGYHDTYAAEAGHAAGWPVASDGKSAWLPHCYGMVGVGRDMPPDTGTGAELYAVIGQAPRHLDRNITVVGRVIDGMEALSALPRGTGELGFYTDPHQRTAIVRVRLASDLPEAERPHFQVMRSDTPAFTAYVEARANRRDPFFVKPVGAIDLCNAPVPVRRAP
jgi:peptidylprolyl isomerase